MMLLFTGNVVEIKKPCQELLKVKIQHIQINSVTFCFCLTVSDQISDCLMLKHCQILKWAQTRPKILKSIELCHNICPFGFAATSV